MRALIVDTSVWIEWLRGNRRDLRELARDRAVALPAIVATELLSGARDRASYKAVHSLIEAFDRQRRLILHAKEDHFLAGEALADLGWPASRKSNDALILACARRIGAEVLTRDLADFKPLAKLLAVTLVS
jgi:predicted nucleic acid-binding protein